MDVLCIAFPESLSARLEDIVRTRIGIEISKADGEFEMHPVIEYRHCIHIIKAYRGELSLMAGVITLEIIIANVCSESNGVSEESVFICTVFTKPVSSGNSPGKHLHGILMIILSAQPWEIIVSLYGPTVVDTYFDSEV